MVSALLLILSAILIGTGVSLIVRDMRARRSGPGFEREEQRPGTTVVANSARSRPGSLPHDLAGQVAALPELSTKLLRAVTGEPRDAAGDRDISGEGRPSLADEWRAVEPMLNSAVERVNVLLALYGNGLLFAALHGSIWPTPIPLFLLGVGLAWLAYRTQSLVGPLVAHALFNGVAALDMILS